MSDESSKTTDPESRPALLALDMGLPEHGLVPSGKAFDDILNALQSRECRVLWLRGPEGSGRSTLTYHALSKLAKRTPGLLGVVRVQCWPGLRIEQALWSVGEFLEQLGTSELYRVLHQRTTLAAKLRLLLQILHDQKIWLWFDDFQNLTGPDSDPSGAILRNFVDSAREFGEFEGRIILVTEKEGPDGISPTNNSSLTLLDLDSKRIVDAHDLYEAVVENLRREFPDEGTPPTFESIPESVRNNPLALRLYLHQSHSDKSALENASHRGAQAKIINALMVQLREDLGSEARRVLDIISLYVRPMGRGTLRALLQDTAEDSQEDDSNDDALNEVETLRRRGIVQGNLADQRIHVHSAIRKTAARRIHAEDREAWVNYHEAIADHLTNTARRARSIWDHYWAFRHLTRCGKNKKAYETQKAFIEFFMGAGYLDLARGVLEILLDRVRSPYREVVIGNLAIVLKNEGQYDRAIELYERSLKAFVDRSDLANAARVYHQIGNTYYAQADHERALENYRQSFEIAKKIKDAMVCLMASVQIGNVHFSTGDHATALEIYREALEAATEMNRRKIMTALHTQIAQIHLIQKKLTDAEASLSSAEAIAMDGEDLRQVLKVLQVRGVVATEGHRIDDAVSHVRRAGRIASSLGDSIEHTNCLLQEGEMEESRQRYRAAARCLIDARSVLMHSIDTSPGDDDREVFRRALTAIDERIQSLRETVGEEVFGRMLRKPDTNPDGGQPVSRTASHEED